MARELEAIAEPQPKVLNLASTIFPWSSTSICQSESVNSLPKNHRGKKTTSDHFIVNRIKIIAPVNVQVNCTVCLLLKKITEEMLYSNAKLNHVDLALSI